MSHLKDCLNTLSVRSTESAAIFVFPLLNLTTVLLALRDFILGYIYNKILLTTFNMRVRSLLENLKPRRAVLTKRLPGKYGKVKV